MTEPKDPLRDLIEGPFARLLSDPAAYERDLWRDMAASDDPLVREMGIQLRDGTASPGQLLAEAAYAPVFERGLDRLRHLDPEALADDLRRAAEQLGERRDKPTGDGSGERT